MNGLTVRIGTYNVGNFSGTGVEAGSELAAKLFREVITADNVDIWALQEDVGFFNEQSELMPYDAVYADYKNYKRCGFKKYNYKAFLTNMPLGEVEQIYYTGDMQFGHAWFLHTQMCIKGKDVCMICVHFDWADKFKRAEQISQVIAFASKYEYSMIIGDYNPDDYINKVLQSRNLTVQEDLDLFRAAGFTPANADLFGTFATIAHETYVPHPCDNIAVSSNIRIHAVGKIHRDWMNDHAALWADVEIC